MRVVPVACERPCLGRTMQNSDFIEFLKTGSGVTVPMHSITKTFFFLHIPWNKFIVKSGCQHSTYTLYREIN